MKPLVGLTEQKRFCFQVVVVKPTLTKSEGRFCYLLWIVNY